MRGGAWDPVVLTRSQVQVHRPKQNGKAIGGPLAWQCRLEHDPIGNCTHCYLGWTDHNRQFFFSISRLALLIYVFIYFTVKSSAGLVFQDKTCGKEWHKVSMTEYRLEKWERKKTKLLKSLSLGFPCGYPQGCGKWDGSFKMWKVKFVSGELEGRGLGTRGKTCLAWVKPIISSQWL